MPFTIESIFGKIYVNGIHFGSKTKGIIMEQRPFSLCMLLILIDNGLLMIATIFCNAFQSIVFFNENNKTNELTRITSFV